jgi:type II secretory pathway component GspD/PulD (secretin)
MLKMIRGNGPNVDQQVQKMTIGIDERSNSLVVRAPDPLFEEVKALVAELDQTDLSSPETTRIVSLRYTNSAAVQKALTSMLGDQATTAGDTGGETRDRRDQNDASRQARRQFRRQMEMFRQMRDMQRFQNGGDGGGGRFRGGRGFGGPPGGFPGGFPGGGGDRGGGNRNGD